MAHAVSLMLAIAASLGLLFLPAMRGGELSPGAHGLLTPLLLVVCGCYAHGVGFRPRMRLLRTILHPAILWLLMAALGLLLANQVLVGTVTTTTQPQRMQPTSP